MRQREVLYMSQGELDMTGAVSVSHAQGSKAHQDITGSMETWNGCLRYTGTLISKWSLWLRIRGPASVCDVYKSLAPLMLYAVALVVVVLYALADQLHDFVCRILIPQYYFPYTTPLALIQVLLNVLALLGLRALGVVPLNPFSLRLAERLMVPAVCGSVQSVLAMWARASAHSGLFPLIGRLLPLFSLAWGHLLGVSKPNSAHFTCLLTAITLTSIGITAYEGVYDVEPLEYFYSPLSLFLHSLSLAWLSNVAQTERDHATTFDLYYTLSVTQSALLVLLCVLHPDTARAITHGSWHTLLFLGYLLSVLLLGSVQIFLVNVTALRYSPLTAALLHSARGLAMPLIKLL
ncbi:solute carrier family 35 member D3 isoform X2 [Ictalurus furcatus]|uniref:solute carrier family 35 member D3 isoform X2 n=1 Tax=Ictalurus furcatus TaxID=66913 RepID=UPI002350C8FD|nr:solute carrier family 35 member D3 isoform X2 [Ictalurus furcatus]